MAVTQATLSQMVDMALGTPEVGAVNFNVIHTILSTIVSKTGLSSLVVEHRNEIPNTTVTPHSVQEPVESHELKSSDGGTSSKTLNDVLKSLAELNVLVEEINGRLGLLENITGATPAETEGQSLGIENLKSQITEMVYKQISEGGGTGEVTGNGIGEQLQQIENNFIIQNDRLVDLQGMLNGRITEMSKQIEDLEKELGVINERLTIQTQSHTEITSSHSFEKDGGNLMIELYSKVGVIQADLEAIQQAAETLAEDKVDLDLRLDAVREELEIVKTIKADKAEVEDELANKADLLHVSRKVSHDDFKARVAEVDVNLEDAFAKLDKQEATWLSERDIIQAELDAKMDKSEIIPIKEYFNDKIKSLLDKIKALSAMKGIEDAAGAKRQIIKDLKCISCDKDVVMKQTLNIEDFKANEGMKSHKSIKPLLTYKLDQVRKQQHKLPGDRNMLHFEEMMQHADPQYKKLKPTYPIVEVDSALHICNRYCGGSHTVTTPLQRVTRTGHYFDMFPPKNIPSAPENSGMSTIHPIPEEPLQTERVQ
uniref:DUF4795 domain-containing protein n=2 Tax=Clastoptera arizonana TaxID=38151 RepID=A0A1B6C0B6_9HEMI